MPGIIIYSHKWLFVEYTVRLWIFMTGITKSICVKEVTLLMFSFWHRSLVTVHTDLHGHTASGCLCRSCPLQWCLIYLSQLSGYMKSNQRGAPSSGISLLGTKSNHQVLNLAIQRVVEHSHFLLGQKLFDNCRVVGRDVMQNEPVTRFTRARSNMSNFV